MVDEKPDNNELIISYLLAIQEQALAIKKVTHVDVDIILIGCASINKIIKEGKE